MSTTNVNGALTLSHEERLEMVQQILQASSVLTLIKSDCEEGYPISGAETISRAAAGASSMLSQVTDRLNA